MSSGGNECEGCEDSHIYLADLARRLSEEMPPGPIEDLRPWVTRACQLAIELREEYEARHS